MKACVVYRLQATERKDIRTKFEVNHVIETCGVLPKNSGHSIFLCFLRCVSVVAGRSSRTLSSFELSIRHITVIKISVYMQTTANSLRDRSIFVYHLPMLILRFHFILKRIKSFDHGARKRIELCPSGGQSD